MTLFISLLIVFCDINQSRHFIYLSYSCMLILIVTGLFEHLSLLPAAIFLYLGGKATRGRGCTNFDAQVKGFYCKQALSQLFDNQYDHFNTS